MPTNAAKGGSGLRNSSPATLILFLQQQNYRSWLCSGELLIESLVKPRPSSEYSFWSKAHPAARDSEAKHRVFDGDTRSSGTPLLAHIVGSQQKTSSSISFTSICTAYRPRGALAPLLPSRVPEGERSIPCVPCKASELLVQGKGAFHLALLGRPGPGPPSPAPLPPGKVQIFTAHQTATAVEDLLLKFPMSGS